MDIIRGKTKKKDTFLVFNVVIIVTLPKFF